MSATGARRPRRSWTQLTWSQGQRARAGQEGQYGGQYGMAAPKGAGYEILSYLIAGILAYGGIGWLIGHFTHIPMLFPIGMLVGVAISIGWVIYRYGVKGGQPDDDAET